MPLKQLPEFMYDYLIKGCGLAASVKSARNGKCITKT